MINYISFQLFFWSYSNLSHINQPYGISGHVEVVLLFFFFLPFSTFVSLLATYIEMCVGERIPSEGDQK